MKNLAVDEFKYVREAFPIAHKRERDAYFSKLSDSPCSDRECAHATQVWTVFDYESMADYHDVYLKCDVIFLTDFFEKFRATCLAH